MARISKARLDHKTYIQILDILDLVLAKMKKEEVRAFMFSLFGRNERIMVSKRFAAILLLNRGKSVSEISRILKLTRPTIIKLGKIMEIKSQGFVLGIKKIKQDQIAKDVKKLLFDIATEFGSSTKIKRKRI